MARVNMGREKPLFASAPPVYLMMQESLAGLAECDQRFIAGIHTGATWYFVTPDGAIWIKGLDGKSTVRETVRVLDDLESALLFAFRCRRWSEAKSLVVCRLDLEGHDLVANEIVVVAVDPKNKLLGPVLFQDKSCDIDVMEWAVAKNFLRKEQ